LRQLRALAPNNFIGKFGALDYALAYGRADEARAAAVQIQARYPADGELVKVLVPWALGDPNADGPAARAALKRLNPYEGGGYLVARRDIDGYLAYYESTGPVVQSYFFAALYSSKPAGAAMLHDPRIKAKLRDFGFVAYWRAKGWPPGCKPLGDSDFECDIASTTDTAR